MKKKEKIIRIEAKPERGVHRAGMFHDNTPRDYPLSRFSKDEIESLKAEKKLIVNIFEGELPDADKTPEEIAEDQNQSVLSQIADIRKRVEKLETKTAKMPAKPAAKSKAADKSKKVDTAKAEDKPETNSGENTEE